ncbi:heavy metal-associated isoprenylated plant protein 26-like protein [Carex littledalei]|uniref:Heavy metal-associated isoprenylated plant protein 26-like protein n=1 Tax=Carex littledalei TaxID=544730 RepID=A0A833QLR5_9POAL|nr:heavy metal-associated isoprenylated plant protein 26-like protein [Carex littledalei]
MANALERAVYSVFSSIFYCCSYQGDHRHDTRSTAHYYSSNPSYSNTFHFVEGKNGYSRRMAKGRPLSLQTVELKVRMCCAGCERVVKHALLKLRGVDSVEVDLAMEKVTVTGYVDRNKVLKEVRRSGKKAEFWPNPDLPRYFTSAKNYFRDEESYRESYNYWRHGYNGDKHGHVPVPQRGEDPVSNLFNDDDVNACHIM